MRRFLSQYGIATGFFCLALILGLTAPHFLTVENFRNVAVQVPVTTIIAVGMTFVILTGGIDLSVGSIHALASVLLAMALTTPWFTEQLGGAVVPVSLALALGVGAGVGLFNGAAVAWFRMPPFIVTLATMRICRGLAKRVTDGVPVGMSDLPGPMGERLNRNLEAIQPLGLGYLGDVVPVAALIALSIVVVGIVLLRRTRFGRHVRAVGSSEEAARLSGVPVARVKLLVYAMVGLLSGLAAIIETAQLQSGSPIAGEGYELAAIAAVVVGGTSLSGGRGSVVGTLVGSVFIIGIMNNALNLYNVQAFWQEVATGAIIFVIVLLDQLARRDRQR
jgi:ribose transport system permease protein